MNKNSELSQNQKKTEMTSITPFETFQKSFIHNSSFFIGTVAILAALLRIFLTDFSMLRLIPTMIAGSLFLILGFVSKKNYFQINFRNWLPYFYLLLVFLIIFNGALGNGGLRAPIAASLFLLPLVSAILIEKNGSLIGFLLCISCILLIVFLDLNGFIKPFSGNMIHIYIPIIYLSISIVTFFIMNSFIKAKKESDTLINQMNQMILYKTQLASLVELAEGMAHEINNPLAIISAKIEFLKKATLNEGGDLESPKVKEIDKILSATQRISKIVSSLQNFSSGVSEENVGYYPVTQILENALLMVEHRRALRDIKINVLKPQSLDGDSNIENWDLHVKRNQFKYVLISLLNNSIDAIEKLNEKWINIQIKKNKDNIQIIITDSGPGLNKKIQEKLFTPFFTTKNNEANSGLGLSTSKKIIQDFNGKIWYDETSPHTSFIIEISQS